MHASKLAVGVAVASTLAGLCLVVGGIGAAVGASGSAIGSGHVNSAAKTTNVTADSHHRAGYKVIAHLATRSITADQRVTVRGAVLPKAPHKSAKLQVRSGKHWKTVARTHLNKRSAFAFSYHPPDAGSFALRVNVPRTSAHAAGASKPLHLTVAPSPYTALATDLGATNCAVVHGGTVQCWGSVLTDPEPAPLTIPGLSDVKAVAATDGTICAVVSSGDVKCVASTYDPSRPWIFATAPTSVNGISHVVKLSGGGAHYCAVERDGSTWCWGQDLDGETGAVSVSGESNTPVRVSGLGPATSVSADSSASCATVTTGGVYCWGRPINDPAAGDDSATPLQVAGLSGTATAVSIGATHACALISDGAVQCWGSDSYGELGDGTGPSSATPVTASDVTNARSVSAGAAFTCVVLSAGTVRCFGLDTSAQIGNGSPAANDAASVKGVDGATAVLAGSGFACAALRRGAARCWGANYQSQLGRGTASNELGAVPEPVAPVAWRLTAVAPHSTVHAGQPIRVTGMVSPAAPGRTITLHAFSYHSAPLSTITTTLSADSRYTFRYPSTTTEVGSLYITVGRSKYHSASADYLGVHVTAVITSLSAGHGHACVATSTRETFCWGDGTDGDIGYSGLPDSFGPDPVSNLPPAHAVAAGVDFSCGLLLTRRIDCWGGNGVGQLGDNGVNPTAAGDVERVVGITNATAITAGEYGACALLATGSVSCWGSGDSDEFGNGHTQNSPVPVTVPGVTDATAITAGFAHICALLKTGSVKCWGANQDGQLGRGTFTPSGGPAVVDGLTKVKAISAGYDHTCALLISGAVKCWGDNDYGQLGTDQPNEHGSPVGVPGIVSAISIGAGGYHTCAVVKSGRVRCWGQGDLGELGNGHKDTGQTPVTVRTLTDAKTVISGYDYSCAVLGGKSDAGDAWCWGNDEDGQDGDVYGHTDRDVPIRVPF